MNILAGIIGLSVVAFVILVVRSLRYVPSGKANYAEKELSYVAPKKAVKKPTRRFYIRDNGTIVKKDLCRC